ncbi:Fe-S cluster protein [Candidatus Roizmanbacteria bacterium RIFCSPLOWO2_01_FULL_45_11]|uniref:Fe-S cluster protein n=1 Tax=Candidatus Roizmanbacteria bacterium RIFCSPLOWO2_01_FULL_45_11 TaxID=1802070 RepID=A0A1F7JH10_9BACT|nr:MAG: Fe-S cluster protein [Candidatus Roizmanbacteria bacterium RIFCSPLOWO2_01_FULL_45_11]
MDDLYRELILDHYKHPRNFGNLPRPTCSAKKNNPLCGDELSVDLNITDGVIEDIKFSGQGCAISVAAASLLSEHVQHMKIGGLQRLSKDDMVKLLNTPLTPVRLKCAMLSLEVAQQAAAKIL